MDNKPNTSRKLFVNKKLLASALAVALAAGIGTYEIATPVRAAAAAPAASAPALDGNSVSALLSLDHAMETLAAHVTPAVVNVAVTSRATAEMQQEQGSDDQDWPFGQDSPFGQMPGIRPREPRIEHGVGSGVLISPDGYIVTNNHVVNGATDIRVTTSDKRMWYAKVVGTDPLTDLAVIKINATNLPSIPWGRSSELHPGQTVLAFGNPLGFRFTVTRGIVSALNRPNPFADDAHKPGGFIQTDAAINPGNSGGALVDARGELVGINTFLISSSGSFSGMGFAIPSQLAQPIVNTLIRDGKVVHPQIGIGISDVTPENAKFFDMKDASGAVITQVEPDSPAAKAGLKVGDVVKKFDGQEVSDATQFQIAVQEKHPGDKATLEVARNGQTTNIPVTLGTMSSGKQTAENSNSHGKARWGIGVADLTPEVSQELQLPDNVHGAVIARVVPGSPADNAGLSRGDVIQQVNRKDVKSAADLQKTLGGIPAGQDALVLVWSHGGSTFRVLHSQNPS